MGISKKTLTLILTGICIFAIQPAYASFTQIFSPDIEVNPTKSKIEIDGNLDDPGWHDAARFDHFHERFPGDMCQPPVKTEALITYDADKIYVAFIAHDDPSEVRASHSERDNFGGDDNVGFFIDTYGNASWAYFFNVNPFGVQVDALWSSEGGEDASFDLIWDSHGYVTDSGFQVEIAIPFSSLKFPNREEQVWKAEFWRNHPREIRRQYSLAAYDRDEPCFVCQWGTLRGIRNVESGNPIEFLPSFVSYQSGSLANTGDPTSNFVNGDIQGEASLGMKYSISSDMTAEATINPDFSQVESDATEINVNSTFALFYPERRPFFQEGSDLFNSWFDLVYTRSINDPIAAGKYIARMNKTNIAFLTAYDEHSPVIIPFEEGSAFLENGKSYTNIFRVKQSMGEDSHLGATITDRRYTEGGAGSALSAEMGYKFWKNFQIETQIIASHMNEPDDPTITNGINGLEFNRGRNTADFDGEKYWGHAVYASFERFTKHWWFDLDYWEASPTFRAENGFEGQNNYRLGDFSFGFNFYVNKGMLIRFQPNFDIGRKWNFDKRKKDEWFRANAEFQLKGQTFLGLHFLESWERLREVDFPGIRYMTVYLDTRPSNLLGFGTRVSFGHQIARTLQPKPIMGNEFSASLWATVKPFNRMTISPNFRYYKSDSLDTGGNIFDGYAMRARVDYLIWKQLSLRLISQYNDFSQVWEFDPLITYRFNPFTLMYFGSTHDFHDYDGQENIGLKQYSRQIFFKIQYLLQT